MARLEAAFSPKGDSFQVVPETPAYGGQLSLRLRTKSDVVLRYGSIMTQTERLALLALAPGVYLRADARCPNCHRKLNATPHWQVQNAVIDWIYECDCCLATWDSQLSRSGNRGVWFVRSSGADGGKNPRIVENPMLDGSGRDHVLWEPFRNPRLRLRWRTNRPM
jgi:hypothetical protein